MRSGQDFFDLYRIPLLSGAGFSSSRRRGRGFIVGERLRDPVGAHDPSRSHFQLQQALQRVVGMAREINYPSIDPRVDRPEFYEPPGAPRSQRRLLHDAACAVAMRAPSRPSPAAPAGREPGHRSHRRESARRRLFPCSLPARGQQPRSASPSRPSASSPRRAVSSAC